MEAMLAIPFVLVSSVHVFSATSSVLPVSSALAGRAFTSTNFFGLGSAVLHAAAMMVSSRPGDRPNMSHAGLNVLDLSSCIFARGRFCLLQMKANLKRRASQIGWIRIETNYVHFTARSTWHFICLNRGLLARISPRMFSQERLLAT